MPVIPAELDRGEIFGVYNFNHWKGTGKPVVHNELGIAVPINSMPVRLTFHVPEEEPIAINRAEVQFILRII